MQKHTINPALDLMIERIIDVPAEQVWQMWTTPEKLMPWFCPRPWKTIACEIDLRVGGKFHTVMQSPEGETHPNTGCYLEIIPNKKLVWTNAVAPGFRPATLPETGLDCGKWAMTAMIMLEPHAAGTQYTALVMHASQAAKIQHEQMGFEDGWSMCLDQLVAMIKTKSANL